jgi:hypothetical protein
VELQAHSKQRLEKKRYLKKLRKDFDNVGKRLKGQTGGKDHRKII